MWFHIHATFPSITLTDSSVNSFSTGYYFYIHDYHISLSINRPPSSSSNIAECFAILEALKLISTFAFNNLLFPFDSLFYLQGLTLYIRCSPSFISLSIRQYLNNLSISGFVSIYGHSGIQGNKISIISHNYLYSSPPSPIPWTGFC